MTAPDNTFTIDFPCAAPTSKPYDVSGTKVERSTVTECEDPSGGTTYAVETTDFSSSLAVTDPNELLDAGAKAAPGLVSDKFTTTQRSVDSAPFAGMPSRAFVYDVTGATTAGLTKKGLLQGRVLVVGQRFYVISTLGDAGAPADLDHFLSTLHLGP